MVRYFVELAGEKDAPIEVVLTESAAGGLEARVDGRALAVELVPAGGACFALRLGSAAHDLVAETARDGSLALTIAGERFTARVEGESEREARKLAAGRAPRAGGPVRSSMPGIVARVLKSAGDAVRRGETVVIVEAMKMENEVKADHDGVLSALDVKAGDRIQGGDRLFEIAAAPDGGSAS